MPTAVECEHCGQRYSVREELLGKRMKCKACGESTALVPAPPRPKTPASAPSSEKPDPSSQRRTRRLDSGEKSTDPGAKQLARRSASPAGAVTEGRTRKLDGNTVPKPSAAPPIEPVGVSASTAPNLLDLLDDSAFPAATGALTSGVVLKASAPAPAEAPKAKKKRKKKKNESGELSDNTKVLFRMAGGAFLVLLGLLAIGRAIYAIVSRDDENGAIGFLVGRWVVGGISSISGGLKLICG